MPGATEVPSGLLRNAGVTPRQLEVLRLVLASVLDAGRRTDVARLPAEEALR